MFNRGSEWRKWDLHIHTPESGMNNQYTNWDNFVKSLFNKAIEKEIAVIGITDYFTIDGYKKLKEDYLNKETKLKELFENDVMKIEKIKQIKIFPNIEFRLDKLVNNRRINYHVLLSDDVSIKDIEENFLQEIKFVYEARPFEENNMRKLTKSNLEDLGDKLKKEESSFTGGSFEIGCSTAIVDNNQIKDILISHKDIFDGKYLIAVPVDEDLSSINWRSQEHMVRKSLYQETNLFFTSNENTISFGLGKKHSSINDFIDEFKTLKACIHGSDAHSEEKLFNPDYNRYCWIKADPTFEGLKQITYEPESRVRIQQSKPEEKSLYKTIDYILLDEDKFWKNKINLNQNLNVIIGGRGTGKSTLLNSIAIKIKNNLSKDIENQNMLNFLQEHLDGITIKWCDNQETVDRDIDFFYQGKMYDIARNEIKFDDLIDEIIIKNNKGDCINQYELKNEELKNDMLQKIDLLFKIQKELEIYNKYKIEKGNEKSINEEIKKLEFKILQFQKTTNITQLDLKLYQNYQTEIYKLEQENKKIDDDLLIIQLLKNKSIFETYYSKNLENISDLIKVDLINYFNELKQDTTIKWNNYLENQEQRINSKKKENNNRIETMKKERFYIDCEDYYKHNLELNELQKKLNLEKQNYNDIINLKFLIDTKQKEKSRIIEKIIIDHKSYKINIYNFVNKLEIKQNDTNIIAKVVFAGEEMRTFLENRLSQKGFERQQYINSIINGYDNNIETFLIKALNGEIDYKNSFDTKTVVTEFFTNNWFYYSFDIKYQNEFFSSMSPGKKSFVILKLLLEFSDKTCPILIDQPEDSLDNRAIYNDLVEYIRNKKIERQIILVTHNPNIVVASDTENIIVANQHGNNSKNRDGIKFQYINGSLENTNKKDPSNDIVLESQGIREHVCEILEGGKEAFQKREEKYELS